MPRPGRRPCMSGITPPPSTPTSCSGSAADRGPGRRRMASHGSPGRRSARAGAAFGGVVRRPPEPAVADRAREGLGLCSLVQGQRLLETGKPTEAEDWFRRATAPGAPADVVRGAFLGLGDVKLAQGNVAAALE